MTHGKEKSKNGGKNYMVNQPDVLQLDCLNQGFLYNKGSSYFKDNKSLSSHILPHHGRDWGEVFLGVYAKVPIKVTKK